jgi:hypothetical protein
MDPDNVLMHGTISVDTCICRVGIYDLHLLGFSLEILHTIFSFFLSIFTKFVLVPQMSHLFIVSAWIFFPWTFLYSLNSLS